MKLLDQTTEWRIQQSPNSPEYIKLRDTYSSGWIAFDDIEFHLPEPLTADEMAQCLVEPTRNNQIPNTGHGETEHYRLLYDPQHPGKIALEHK